MAPFSFMIRFIWYNDLAAWLQYIYTCVTRCLLHTKFLMWRDCVDYFLNRFVGHEPAAVQSISSQSAGRCLWRWCALHMGLQHEDTDASFWRRSGWQTLHAVHGTRILALQSDASCFHRSWQTHSLLRRCHKQVSHIWISDSFAYLLK